MVKTTNQIYCLLVNYHLITAHRSWPFLGLFRASRTSFQGRARLIDDTLVWNDGDVWILGPARIVDFNRPKEIKIAISTEVFKAREHSGKFRWMRISEAEMSLPSSNIQGPVMGEHAIPT